MDPTRAYDGKAGDYADHRPPYAPAAIRTMVETTGVGPGQVVAEFGSGTGNLTRHLLEHAKTVFAVEPNAEMRQEAELRLGGRPGFVSIAAVAEQVPIRDGSIDLVAAGQAAHWFDRRLTLAEWTRILKPDGWVALIGNLFDGMEAPEPEGLIRRSDRLEFSFPACATNVWEQYIGGMRSAASAPHPDDPDYPRFEEEHRQRFDRRAVDGVIAVPYTTVLSLGRLERG